MVIGNMDLEVGDILAEMDDLGRLMFDNAQWRALSKKQSVRIEELEKQLAGPAVEE